MKTTRAIALFAGLGIVPAAEALDFSITPRYSLYFDNQTQRQTGEFSDEVLAAQEDIIGGIDAQLEELLGPILGPGIEYTHGVPDFASVVSQQRYNLIGATLGLGSATTQVAITALAGKAQNSATTVSVGTESLYIPSLDIQAVDTQAVTGRSDFDSKRLDIEGTIQHRLNDTFSVIGGLRYERITWRVEQTVDVTTSRNMANLVSLLLGGDISLVNLESSADNLGTGRTHLYSLRLGAAAYVPVSPNQSFYVNGFLHASYAPAAHVLTNTSTSAEEFTASVPSETDIGPDLSVGYLLRLSDQFAIDARYRATVYFPVDGKSSFSDPRVNHGVLLGATWWID